MHNGLARLGAVALIFLLSVSVAGAAQATADYRPFVVKGRIWISVPSAWEESDAASRQRVAELGASLVGKPPLPAAALAVHSVPRPSGMLIRVSLVDKAPDEAVSQDELTAVLREPARQQREELDAVVSQLMVGLRPGLARAGIRILGSASGSIVRLGGKLAIALKYQRTDMTQADQTYWVTQYHVPMGPQTAVITLSVRTGDAYRWQPVVTQVLRSVSIR